MKKRSKIISLFFILIVFCSTIIGCSSGEPCYIGSISCDTNTRKYVNKDGEKLYYCKKHRSECNVCGAKATKNYENMAGSFVFVCNEHYPE